MWKWLFRVSLIIGILLTTSLAAFAEHSTSNSTEQGIRTGWEKAMDEEDGKGCVFCHSTQPEHTSGPHGGYESTTDKCTACHAVHKAQNESLLPGKTVAETCNFCHDLTQSQVAPYYSTYMATKTEVKSAHRVDGLKLEFKDNVMGDLWTGSLSIPGGDPLTGDAKNLNTSHQGSVSKNNFTCDSCHTPHAIENSTVDPYLGESQLKFEIATGTGDNRIDGKAGRFWITDRLLKARLNGVSGFVYEQYNSDWCAACHMGRYKNGTIHNHPVAMSSQAENSAERDRAMAYQFLDFLASSDFDTYPNKSSLLNAAKDLDGVYRTFYWATDEAYAAMGNKVDYTVGLVRVTGPRSLKKDPRTNKQYAMTATDPLNNNALRTIDGDGSVPINDYAKGPACQQCHGNPRDVEKPFLASLLVDSTNRVMTFPHVSYNEALKIEDGDDFCTNCHGIEDLP